MEIFNTKILNQRQRWNRAVLFAIGGTILSIIVCVLLQRLINIRSSLFYLAAAYFLSWLILETGHGVQVKFSILAAVCTVIVIIVSDMFVTYGMLTFTFPVNAILSVLRSYVSISINSLLSLIIKIGAISLAYGKARIV